MVLVMKRRIASHVEIEMNVKLKEVVNTLNLWGSCFSMEGGPQEEMTKKVSERETTFCTMKIVFSGRRVIHGVKRELYESSVARTVAHVFNGILGFDDI